MRRPPISLLAALLAASLPGFPATAETPAGVAASLARDTGAAVSLQPATGAARFATLGERGGSLAPGRARGAGVEAQVRAFLRERGGAFGVVDPDRELVLDRRFVDALGAEHLSYRQVYRGVPVFGGVLRAHVDAAGNLAVVNGTLVPAIHVDPRPRLAARVAGDRARSILGALAGMGGPRAWRVGSTRLLVFRAGLAQGLADGRVHLVWEAELTSARGGRQLLYVDAHTGKLVDRVDGVLDALSREVYNQSISSANLLWKEGDALPFSSGASPGDAAGVNEIIDFTGDAYDFYLNLSSGLYPSWDAHSAKMLSIWRDIRLENPPPPAQPKCPNANWNGTSTNFCDGITTDDVVAHEWTHAYTQETHGLIYQWQPGALNEAYSDIFGETVDRLNGAGVDDPQTVRATGICTQLGGGGSDTSVRWLLGERQTGNVIRDMYNPNCEGDPGKVSDGRYRCATVADENTDSGGVHTNSGVPNHAYALLVDGGSFNGQTISGIGFTKAAAVYFRAMTVYQTPFTDFADHADAVEQSCRDLAAAGTNLPSLTALGPSGQAVTNGDCDQLARVLSAVEMRRPPSQCNFTPLLDQSPPPLCTSGGPVPVLANDFESGFAGWTVSNQGVTQGDYTPRDWDLDSSLPKDRAGTAAFALDSLTLGDCAADDESGTMQLDSPTFTMPTSGATPLLKFDHYLATETSYDGGNLKASVDDGPFTVVPASAFRYNDYSANLDNTQNTNPLAGQPAWTGTDAGAFNGTWGQSQVDLSQVAQPGQRVRLRFDFGVDGCNGNDGWYVDDVLVYQCGAVQTGPCVQDGDTLCLLGGRYKLEVAWQNQYSGASGKGLAVPNSDFTGFFAFDNAANVELIVKMLDFGNVVKVFYGQLTDLHFSLTITDTQTGASRTYRNSEGDCGAVDDGAFAKTAVLALSNAPGASGTCVAGNNALCLLGNRFKVEVDWRNQFDNSTGRGVPTKLSDLTGLFTYTDPRNVELLTKTLDFGDRILFIYGTLSNLEYTLHVTDTTTGRVNTYFNPAGNFCGAIDNTAF